MTYGESIFTKSYTHPILSVDGVDIFLTELCFQHMVYLVGNLNQSICFVLGRYARLWLVKSCQDPITSPEF